MGTANRALGQTALREVAESAAHAAVGAAEAGALAEVRAAATEIAIAAAREVIAERMDAAADAALIDHAVADLPRVLRA